MSAMRETVAHTGTTRDGALHGGPGSCDGCGVCCLHVNTPHCAPEEMDKLPDELRTEIKSYLASVRSRDRAWPCLWLDRASGVCIHYELRPRVCRDFALGGPECLAFRREYGLEVETVGATECTESTEGAE